MIEKIITCWSKKQKKPFFCFFDLFLTQLTDKNFEITFILQGIPHLTKLPCNSCCKQFSFVHERCRYITMTSLNCRIKL